MDQVGYRLKLYTNYEFWMENKMNKIKTLINALKTIRIETVPVCVLMCAFR